MAAGFRLTRLAEAAVIQKGKYPDHRQRADNENDQHWATETRAPGLDRCLDDATIFFVHGTLSLQTVRREAMPHKVATGLGSPAKRSSIVI